MVIITDKEYRTAMTADLATIREKLGGGGAAARTATLALDIINESRNKDRAIS